MMSLWLGASLLCVIALVCVFWPLFRQRREVVAQSMVNEVETRLDENIRLFREHIVELDAQWAAVRFDDAQHAKLKLDP